MKSAITFPLFMKYKEYMERVSNEGIYTGKWT